MPWELNGNSGIKPTTNFLGTRDERPLAVRTNNAERMRVSPDGKVGIGMTSPETKLQVAGGLWNPTDTEGDFKIGDATYRLKIGVATGGGGAGDVRIRAHGGTNRLMLGSGTLDTLFVVGDRVGIGTAGLSRTLHVQGSEIHSGGGGAGYSFGNRETATFVEGPGGGERWVWYASGGRARLWSGTDKLSVALDPTFMTTVIVGPGGNGRLKIRHIDGKHWQNDNNDPLYLNWNTGQPVFIGHDAVKADLHVSGDIFLSSDAKLKTDVAPITDALEKLQKIRGIGFAWLTPDRPFDPSTQRRDVGVIAQEVEAVFPELVDSHGGRGEKGVNYSGLTGVLIEASKELKKENDALRQRIEALERAVAGK